MSLIPPGDENTAATPYFGLMPPVEMPAGTWHPQINMTSHSIVDTPPVVLHHSTSSMDRTAAVTALSIIGFSGIFVLPKNFLEHQLPHVATASDAVGSFYTPG
jgi:hypothetical protein